MIIKQMFSLGLLMAFAVGCFAEDSESIIKYRQAVMKVVGGHMQAMGTIMRGNVHGDDFALHADGMAKIAKLVGTVFPKGSGEGKTEALAQIWDKPAEFTKRVEAFQGAAAKLAETATGGDRAAIAGAMKELGGTCKGCHDDFRKE